MQNGAQIHLLVNHLPVIVPALGVAVLVVGLFLNLRETKMVGLWIIFFGALSALPAYFSGAPAEKVVKNYPGITRAVIRQHQAWAKNTFIFMELLAVATLALLVFLRRGRPIPFKFWFLFLLTCLISVILVAQTAHLGGEIRHEEILSDDLV